MSFRNTHRRASAWVVLALCAGLVLAGCGEDDPGPISTSSLGEANTAVDPDAYMQRMQKIGSKVDAGQIGFGEAVAKGDAKALRAAAKRWDAAVAELDKLKPPPAAARQHAELVTAMEGLGVWNHRIADAAAGGGRKAAQATAKQAQSSEDAKQYNVAIDELSQAGFDITA